MSNMAKQYFWPKVRLGKGAIHKVHELMREEGDMQLMLRAFIMGGGCSGFQYGFSFESEKKTDDICIESIVPSHLPDKMQVNQSQMQAWQLWIDQAKPPGVGKHRRALLHELGPIGFQKALLAQPIAGLPAQINADLQRLAWGFYAYHCKKTCDKVRLLIDPISYQYLKTADIDYVSDVKGQRFVIKNPNAKSTCGCGSSFSA
jgi:Fe-S cluster assembly iron-binding protein IscA